MNSFIRLIVLPVLLALCYPQIALSGETCETAEVTVREKATSLVIDTVWSGTRVGFSGLSERGRILVTYYDQDRYLTVAEFKPDLKRLCRHRLPSRFSGWDSHNYTTVAHAPDGTVHVAGNMHVSPLVYARTDSSGSLNSLVPQPMVGRDEAQVTYPRFMTDKSGNLFFMYRAGRSGRGSWVLNSWNGKTWNRVSTLFSDHSSSGFVSAYPTTIEQDAQGVSHVAMVWRRTSGVETNFAVTYAKTTDFRHWSKADGSSIDGIPGADNSDLIEAPGEKSGLLNNAQLVLGAHGPTVIYTRYGAGGHNVLIATVFDGKKWVSRDIARADRQTELVGGGSLAQIPRFLVEKIDAKNALVSTAFPGQKLIRTEIDLQTLAAKPAPHRASKPVQAEPRGRGHLADAVNGQALIKTTGQDRRTVGEIRWTAQASNRDQPRQCTLAAPSACSPPPSTLHLILNHDMQVKH